MATTVSRWLPKHPVAAPSGAASGPSLADALADRDIACIRIRARYTQRGQQYHDLTAWTTACRRIMFDAADRDADQTLRDQLIDWYLEIHPEVDWRFDHQIIVATGEILGAPDTEEPGGIPEDDGAFGGRPPVLLPQAHTASRRAA